MKALYISYDGATESLGQSQVIPYLLGLKKKGIDFTLLSFEKKGTLRQNSFYKVNNLLMGNGIKWWSLRYHKRPSILATSFDIFQGLIFGGYLIIRDRVEIVHARSYVAAMMALLLKKLFGAKFIFDMRGFWADERVEGGLWKRGVLYRIVKKLEKRFFLNSDEIVVLTEKAKETVREWNYTKDLNVSVIPCCVDTNKFLFKPESRQKIRSIHKWHDKFIFIHTGSLEDWYMKEEMIDFFKVANGLIPNAHFLILTQDDENKIKRLIFKKNMNMEDFTILSVPHDDVPNYLSAADVGLFFITPVSSKKASSPTKFAEYLSCGLPVVINTGIGDLDGFLTKGDVGVLVRGFYSEEYLKCLKRLMVLLEDRDLRKRCREMTMRHFVLAKAVERYWDIYIRLKSEGHKWR